MKSNNQMRLSLTASLENADSYTDPREFSPGDQVYFRIPADAGETNKLWAYVLKPSTAPAVASDSIRVVVDSPMVFHKNPKFKCGNVLVIKPEDVERRIPVDPHQPLLRVVLEDGVLIDLLRVDGQTAPVAVQVDQEDTGGIYEVTHRTYRKLTK